MFTGEWPWPPALSAEQGRPLAVSDWLRLLGPEGKGCWTLEEGSGKAVLSHGRYVGKRPFLIDAACKPVTFETQR